MSHTLSFQETVRARHLARSFLSTPAPDAVICSVLEDAQRSPSNCNTQPWQVHIASGATRDALSQAILADDEAGRLTPDSASPSQISVALTISFKDQGAAYYRAIGVAREATEDRRTAARYNLEFFGAPHVALLFMPAVGDNVRVAGDIGMYSQTFLLSLTARGLGGIPRETDSNLHVFPVARVYPQKVRIIG